jgi:hypothetical protein
VVSSLVEAARFNSAYQGELARTFLESHGLHAVVFDSGINFADGGGLAFAVRLMVLDEDLDEAHDLLKDYDS